MKAGGIVTMFAGMVFTTTGAYALEGGTSIIGIMLLLGGIAMTHIGFRFSRPIILTIVLGECSSIIPAILFGMGYNLVAGITLLVLSYSFIAMLFLWLTKW